METVRIHLRTGRIRKSPAPADTKFVLAGGDQLWELPGYGQASAGPWRVAPFLLNNCPTTVAAHAGDNFLFPLVQFVDGQWRQIDRYALLPRRTFDLKFMPIQKSNVFVAFFRPERFRNKYFNRSGQWRNDFLSMYRVGLDTGTRDEAIEFYRQIDDSSVCPWADDLIWRYDGWVNLAADRLLELMSQEPNNRSFRFWIDPPENQNSRIHRSGAPYVSLPKVYINSVDTTSIAGAFWEYNFEASYHLTPIADPQQEGVYYLVGIGTRDGHLQVSRFEKENYRVIARQGNQLIRLICLDGVLFFGLAVVVPMLVLTAFIRLYERFEPTVWYSYGQNKAQIASASRRGMARLIDLLLVAVPMFLSIVLHPNAARWWGYVSSLAGQFLGIIDVRTWDEWVNYIWMMWIESIHTLLLTPILWWLTTPALLLAGGHILWQARSGKTTGKWLCGLTLLRTTLRPCGVPRSLFREVLLVADSMFWLSWVPGTVLMLATTNRQRLGDLMADTIVVTDSAHTDTGATSHS